MKRLNEYTLLLEPNIKIYLSRELESSLDPQAILQLQQAAQLPSVHKICALPDVHPGYGLPVGGVMATRARDGIISPGAVGVDINCGVRLVMTDLAAGEFLAGTTPDRLLVKLREAIPAGEGKNGVLQLPAAAFEQVLANGVAAVVQAGWGRMEDLEVTEDHGQLSGADPGAIPAEFREIGRRQLGSLGSGNHFIEFQLVDQIFEPELAARFGILPGAIGIMIHSGSRGMGNRTATHFVKAVCQPALRKYGLSVPHPNLACVPWHSPEGQLYWGAMAGAANYAWANRQVLMVQVAAMLNQFFKRRVTIHLVYDVAHNIAKLEEYDGQQLLVHRKGATRAFPADDPQLNLEYRPLGQPALIPGSMGTRSWVVVATPKISETMGSVNHGAGRLISRSQATGTNRRGQPVRAAAISNQDFWASTRDRGIRVASGSNSDLRDEAPGVYKDSEAVLATIVGAGLALPVAALRPLVVLKG